MDCKQVDLHLTDDVWRAYEEAVRRTESVVAIRMVNAAGQIVSTRLLHGVMGNSTEAGELLDQLKKHIFYGKELDRTNIIEELGDQFWYMAVITHCLNIPLSEILEKNINKLKARYPEKFSSEKAINRDLEKEREVLEK